ncbi:hypothetical protein TAMA11512_04370 [Selenomonas sp. TAMA-11512]|nr:hypothetical protein TAMA11512_04370 [Selenomonas sp. TAMA-11512]
MKERLSIKRLSLWVLAPALMLGAPVAQATVVYPDAKPSYALIYIYEDLGKH